MQVKLIAIGNSKGFILPEHFIHQYRLDKGIILETKEDCIILKSLKPPRHGWEEQFKDSIRDKESFKVDNKFDNEEWTWL